jgi:hypothetical protein
MTRHPPDDQSRCEAIVTAGIYPRDWHRCRRTGVGFRGEHLVCHRHREAAIRFVDSERAAQKQPERVT